MAYMDFETTSLRHSLLYNRSHPPSFHAFKIHLRVQDEGRTVITPSNPNSSGGKPSQVNFYSYSLYTNTGWWIVMRYHSMWDQQIPHSAILFFLGLTILWHQCPTSQCKSLGYYLLCSERYGQLKNGVMTSKKIFANDKVPHIYIYIHTFERFTIDPWHFQGCTITCV